MSKNRSCKEFIPKPIIPSNYEELTAPHNNCANCIRWSTEKERCREEVWVKEWIEYTTNPNDDNLPEITGWCHY